jgi:hypothetical protein
MLKPERTLNQRTLSVINALVSVYIVFGLSTVAHAQASIEPIFTSDLKPIINIRWSADGETLLFFEAPVSGEVLGPPELAEPLLTPVWYAYQSDPTGGSSLTAYEASPERNTAFMERSPLPIATDDEGNLPLIFPSPDGRFLVYAAQQPANWESNYFPLGIVNTQTGETALMEEIIVPIHENMDSSYIIEWSQNSQAFTVFAERLGSVPRIFYVTNFTDTVSEITLMHLEAVPIGDQTVYPIDIYDVSNDGNRLFLRAYTIGNQVNFVIWNAQQPEQSQIIAQLPEGIVAGGAFSGENDQNIVYVDVPGIIQVNLQTGETTILDSTVNTTWVDRAWFSPDASRVALLETTDFEEERLYVIDIPIS